MGVKGLEGVHWELAGSVCPPGPAGISGHQGGIGGLVEDVGCLGQSGGLGVSGVHWGLAGSVGVQGPAGV